MSKTWRIIIISAAAFLVAALIYTLFFRTAIQQKPKLSGLDMKLRTIATYKGNTVYFSYDTMTTDVQYNDSVRCAQYKIAEDMIHTMEQMNNLPDCNSN